MTVSGTTVFDLQWTEAIEEAYERAGAGSEVRGGYEMRTARRSINLLFVDWSNRGLNMWTTAERSLLLTQGLGTYTLGTDIVDTLEQMIQLPPGSGSSGATRYDLSRVSLSTHATRTNPGVTGRPTEVYYDRQQPAPVAHIWPLPGDGGPYTLYYWVLRRIDDAGAYTNTGDFPFRFLPPFIAGLAFYVAQKKQPDNLPLLTRLENDYEKTWLRASEEDREKAPLSIVPRSSSYRVS